MKLAMTLLVRDEADIIAANLDFHLARGVDVVVAIDNGSVDGTRDILDTYERAGHAAVFDEPGRTYAQSEWMTRAALHARDALGADWVLNNDADEFWVPPGGSLKDVLADTDAQVLRCERKNMICAREVLGTSSGAHPWAETLDCRVANPVPVPKLEDFYRDPLPCPYFYLALPPKVLVQTAGLVRIAQGNHSARFETERGDVKTAIRIVHYPLRSPSQFETKIVQGAEAYFANADLPERMGWHWRRWYRMYQTAGIEAALADALPSAKQLERDLATGHVIRDRRFRDLLEGPPPASRDRTAPGPAQRRTG